MASKSAGNRAGFSGADPLSGTSARTGIARDGNFVFLLRLRGNGPELDEENDRNFFKVLYSTDPLPDGSRERQPPADREVPGEYLAFERVESRYGDAEEFGEETKQHQLLGYPLYIQEENMVPGQLLLLQRDSDEEQSGWMWGDCGRLFFRIKPGDLAAANFDRVKIIPECYQ